MAEETKTDVTTSTDSSTEETKTETQQTEEEQKVPFSRFKEVNDELKSVKDEIASLRTQQEKGTTTPEQDKELQAKQYLEKLIEDRLSAKETKAKQAEVAELKKFNSDVQDVLDINPGVKKSDFISFLEKEGDDYSSVTSAMKAYKRINDVQKTAVEKAKEELKKKPGNLKNEGSSDGKAPETDKNRSIRDIAEEAIRTIKK